MSDTNYSFTEKYIDHEVRVRMLEKIASSVENKFKHLEDKLDSHFKWLLGSILGLSAIMISILSAIALHAVKLA